MRRTLLTAAAVAAVALAAPTAASAQLTLTGLSCSNGGAVTTMGANGGCAGAFAGNNKNQDVVGYLTANVGGDWTDMGSSDDVDFGPFASSPTGGTGTLTFDNTVLGRFVLAIKAGNAFSLYGFDAPSGLLSIDFTTIGVSVNQNGVPNGLSHATLYRTGLNVVPEPSTYALLGTGLVGLAGVARRRRTAKA